jgi:4-aminobutyrate aminotransferase-like enzyme
VPDVVAVGKGLASGFPISDMLTRPEMAAAWKPMQHTSTFMGNPIGSAAALASLDIIEKEGLVQRSAELGAHLKDALLEIQPKHPLMGDVRGLGTMVGIEVVKNRETREPGSKEGQRVVDEMMTRGVMATNYGGTYHNVIKMSPPLVITLEQLNYGIKVIDESLTAVENSL